MFGDPLAGLQAADGRPIKVHEAHSHGALLFRDAFWLAPSLFVPFLPGSCRFCSLGLSCSERFDCLTDRFHEWLQGNLLHASGNRPKCSDACKDRENRFRGLLRCGAVPEEVWVDRFLEGVAASLGDDPSDSIGGKRTAFRSASPSRRSRATGQ